MVVFVGGRLHSSKKGFGLPQFAHHLGDMERAQCKEFSKKLSLSFIVLDNIKKKAHLWVLCGC
jgi:hypothetical protein